MVQHGPGLGLEDGQEINRHQIGVVFLAFRCRSLPLCTFIGERINTGLCGGIHPKGDHLLRHFGGEHGPKRIQKVIEHVYSTHS